MGGRLGAWALVFIRGGSFSYVGGGFRAWATVFVRRRPFSCVSGRFRAWAVVSVRGRSSPCVGGRLQAWEVVGGGGIVVARGVVSCDLAGTVVWNKRAYRIPEQRRTTNFDWSFVIRLPRHRQ